MEKTTKTISLKPNFNHEELHNAILYAQDILERCMVPFVLLDETAAQMFSENPILDLPEISIGVMQRHWTYECRQMFRTWVPAATITKANVYFDYEKVPIIIWLIQGDYQFFKFPDTRWYYQTEFHLPNPFVAYWKSRNIIK